MRSSNAETMVRAAMLANVGPSLDAAMFNTNAAVPGISPAGILHGVSPLTATAGGTLSAMVTDIAALADALKCRRQWRRCAGQVNQTIRCAGDAAAW